jgi:hypothetical protein
MPDTFEPEETAMKDQLIEVAYTVELEAGEKLTLPPNLVETVGPGRWVLTVRPWMGMGTQPTRRHDAFLNGYAPEDEGLYEDLPR